MPLDDANGNARRVCFSRAVGTRKVASLTSHSSPFINKALKTGSGHHIVVLGVSQLHLRVLYCVSQ